MAAPRTTHIPPLTDVSASMLAALTLFAGAFCKDSRYSGTGCSASGTSPGGVTNQSIAVRGPASGSSTAGYCRLDCNTTAVAAGISSASLNYGPVYSYGGNATAALLTTRVTNSRAVRVTLDPRGYSPRMIRVYYSSTEDFINLALSTSVEAPAQLQNATSVSIGITGASVSRAASVRNTFSPA